MYQPPHFREERIEVQHALIRAYPFGLLVSAGADGLLADPMPFLLDTDASTNGTLRTHMARANPHWRALQNATEALVVFQGADAYVTPSWYPSKHETGKAVPTWNYAMVQVHGTPRVVEDREWLLKMVTDLTSVHEAGRTDAWAVSDAPASFVEAQLKGIVGVEIEIARITGKWKISQNRPVADRVGVVAGLEADGATAMAQLVRDAE